MLIGGFQCNEPMKTHKKVHVTPVTHGAKRGKTRATKSRLILVFASDWLSWQRDVFLNQSDRIELQASAIVNLVLFTYTVKNVLVEHLKLRLESQLVLNYLTEELEFIKRYKFWALIY